MDNEKNRVNKKPSGDKKEISPHDLQEIDSALIKRLEALEKIANDDELKTTKKSFLRKILDAIGFNK